MGIGCLGNFSVLITLAFVSYVNKKLKVKRVCVEREGGRAKEEEEGGGGKEKEGGEGEGREKENLLPSR